MSRGPAKFKESDVRRAIRAFRKEGIEPQIEIAPDGNIKVMPVAHDADDNHVKRPKPRKEIIF